MNWLPVDGRAVIGFPFYAQKHGSGVCPVCASVCRIHFWKGDDGLKGYLRLFWWMLMEPHGGQSVTAAPSVGRRRPQPGSLSFILHVGEENIRGLVCSYAFMSLAFFSNGLLVLLISWRLYIKELCFCLKL